MLDADCLEDGETFKNALCIYRCICNYVKDGGNVRAAHCHICSLCRRYTLGPEKYEVTIINVMPLCVKTQRRKTLMVPQKNDDVQMGHSTTALWDCAVG